jgi:hypothetical protein
MSETKFHTRTEPAAKLNISYKFLGHAKNVLHYLLCTTICIAFALSN